MIFASNSEYQLPSFGQKSVQSKAMEVAPVIPEKNSLEVPVKSNEVKVAGEAQIEAYEEVFIKLRRMVNNPVFSDVVFLCKDGNRVYGARILLSGVSGVLTRMLMNGVAEARQSEFALPEISSPVLLSVFELLYTGTLVDYRPQNLRIACEVIVASRFFVLPKLEKAIRKFVNDQIVGVAGELPQVPFMLKEAAGPLGSIWSSDEGCGALERDFERLQVSCPPKSS